MPGGTSLNCIQPQTRVHEASHPDKLAEALPDLRDFSRPPLAHKVGGGRKDIIAVVAIRTSLASLLYAQVLHAFPSDNLFNWLLTTSAVFVVILLMEIHWHRKVLQ